MAAVWRQGFAVKGCVWEEKVRKGKEEVLRRVVACVTLFYLIPFPVFLMLLVATIFVRSFGNEVFTESSFDIIVAPCLV